MQRRPAMTRATLYAMTLVASCLALGACRRDTSRAGTTSVTGAQIVVPANAFRGGPINMSTPPASTLDTVSISRASDPMAERIDFVKTARGDLENLDRRLETLEPRVAMLGSKALEGDWRELRARRDALAAGIRSLDAEAADFDIVRAR